MAARRDTSDYRSLFLNDVPMMDTRAPAEFQRGAFPRATSLPLMTDAERAQVGTRYKQAGQEAAISLGHELVAGDTRAERLAGWCEFARAHPQGYVYCFRGGLRSQTVQQWLRDEGIDYPLVIGGYKAMRQYLLQVLPEALAKTDLVLISGKTGTGKTRVIQRLERSVDLEGLAGHRGSTFGQLPEDQPAQIDFENALSIALLKLDSKSGSRLYLEDEGRMIGRLYLPQALREAMEVSPMVVVEQNLQERVEVIIEDYVIDLGRRYRALHGDCGPELHQDKLQHDLGRIRKRLGGERQQQVSAAMQAAFSAQRAGAGPDVHSTWITTLLQQYYDPMYEYQLAQRGGEVLFRGDRDAVVQWASETARQC